MSQIKSSSIIGDEFRTLFLYNMLDKLKIYSNILPIRAHNRNGIYDDSDLIKTKISNIFTIDKNTPMPPQEYKVNMLIEEKYIYSLAELESFNTELNKKIVNYKLGLMAGESLDATVDRFLRRIQNFMNKKMLPEYAGDVVSVLAQIVKLSQLSEKEKEYFYKSLANGKVTKQKFYDIVSNTCEDFKFEAYKDASALSKALKPTCECPSEVSDSSLRFPRKSLALLSASEDIKSFNNRAPLALTLGKCSTSSSLWHYWLQVV